MPKASRSENRPMAVELPIRIGSYDIDYAGIVSNIVYVRWLEDLRLRWLEAYFPLPDQVERGYVPVLLSTQIEYKHALRMFDAPTGHLWVRDFGRLRWTVEAEFRLHDEPVATAIQTGVLLRLDNHRPVPIPAYLREQLEAARAASPDSPVRE